METGKGDYLESLNIHLRLLPISIIVLPTSYDQTPTSLYLDLLISSISQASNRFPGKNRATTATRIENVRLRRI